MGDRAREEEPAVTATLIPLAESYKGSMYQLEHRLKTYNSTVRKLRVKLHAGRTLESIELDDTLRYTVQIEDQPPGNYVKAVQDILQTLEKKGHSVVRIKNYWPADDNYSGLTSVLRTPSGLSWELQFHTSASLKVQKATRPLYEELRRADTPLERKRVLFDEMTKAWNEVPIPLEALQPQNLHARELIKTRERP